MISKMFALLIFSTISVQAQISESCKFNLHEVVYFVNGLKADSLTLGAMSCDSVYAQKFCTPYGYPAGAVFIQTKGFVNHFRPVFYKNLKSWIKDPYKIIIVDEKPLRNKKLLLSIAETSIEGFTITHQGKNDTIEVFLSPGFALNYR